MLRGLAGETACKVMVVLEPIFGETACKVMVVLEPKIRETYQLTYSHIDIFFYLVAKL